MRSNAFFIPKKKMPSEKRRFMREQLNRNVSLSKCVLCAQSAKFILPPRKRHKIWSKSHPVVFQHLAAMATDDELRSYPNTKNELPQNGCKQLVHIETWDVLSHHIFFFAQFAPDTINWTTTDHINWVEIKKIDLFDTRVALTRADSLSMEK